MEHPLITDVNHLTPDELQSKISDLQKKLSWAQRTNQHVAAQISMALETYTTRYQQILQKTWASSQSPDGDHSDKINIS